MLLHRNIVFVGLSVIVMLFLYSLYQRIPHIDDAWIGEQVFWLDQDGVVMNVLMKNYSDNHNGLIAYHKAFVHSGLWAVQLFGFSLWVLKSVSLFYLLVFFGIFYYYLVKLKKIITSKQFIPIAILLLLEPHIFEYAFVFRPEIMLMTTGFLSFVFLEYSFKSDKFKTIFVVLSSILASISTLVHLNGVVFVIAGGLILIIKKQNRNMAWYILTSLPFVFLYFSHLDSVSGIYHWYNQLMAYNSGTVDVGFNLNSLVNILLKPFEEHLRFFHSPKEISLSLLLLTTLILGFKTIRRKMPLLLTYTFILVIGLGFIAPVKTAKYLIPFLPFFTIMVVLIVNEFWKTTSKNYFFIPKTKEAISILVVLILFLGVSFSYDGYLSFQKFTPVSNNDIIKQYVKKPTKEAIILAPMTFIFNEIHNYKEIVSLMSFNERSKTNSQIKSLQFFDINEEEGIDYILINEHYIDKFNLGPLYIGDNAGNYLVVGKSDELTVLVKNELENALSEYLN